MKLSGVISGKSRCVLFYVRPLSERSCVGAQTDNRAGLGEVAYVPDLLVLLEGRIRREEV